MKLHMSPQVKILTGNLRHSKKGKILPCETWSKCCPVPVWCPSVQQKLFNSVQAKHYVLPIITPAAFQVPGAAASQSGTRLVYLLQPSRHSASQNHHLKVLLVQLEAPLASLTGVIPFCPNSAKSPYSGVVSQQPAPSRAVSPHYDPADLEGRT